MAGWLVELKPLSIVPLPFARAIANSFSTSQLTHVVLMASDQCLPIHIQAFRHSTPFEVLSASDDAGAMTIDSNASIIPCPGPHSHPTPPLHTHKKNSTTSRHNLNFIASVNPLPPRRMACSLRGIAALLVLLLLPAIPVIAFNAPVLASLVNPAVDACAADPEGWVKGPVTSATQEAAVQKVRLVYFCSRMALHSPLRTASPASSIWRA